MRSRITNAGHLVFRAAPDAEWEHIAAHRDVRLGYAQSVGSVDRGGRVDRVLSRYAPSSRVTRAFYARRGLGRPGTGHLDYDDVERSIGLSRTFRVDVEKGAPVESLVLALRDEANVEMATPSYLVLGDGARTPLASVPDRARAQVGAMEALEIEPGDSALIVGLIDSGVDREHPALSARLRPGVSSVALPSRDLGNGVEILDGVRSNAQNVDDDEGHGTACAGILSATGDLLPPGLAGAARLLPIRGLCAARIDGRAELTIVGSVEDIDSGWKSAIDLGARVLNLSFGTAESQLLPDDPVPHVALVQYALARGCVLVAASGNTGDETKYFPAAIPGVIAVGAVDAKNRPASFSTRGEHVVISAPGMDIASAAVGGGTDLNTGTSFAAPFVTGAVALMMARAARHSHPLDGSTIRRLLEETARAFGGGSEATGCGAGVLDVPAALRAVDRLAVGHASSFAHALKTTFGGMNNERCEVRQLSRHL